MPNRTVPPSHRARSAKVRPLLTAVTVLVVIGGSLTASTAQAEVPSDSAHSPSHLGAPAMTAKLAAAECPPDGCYFYAGAQQSKMSPPVTTMSALFTIDDPWMSSCCAYHTLAEMTMQDTISPLNNVIEFGWTRDNTKLYADTKPRLFSSLFVDGVWQGYNRGFVDYEANTAVNMGQDLTPYLDTEKQFSIQYVAATKATPARWWLWFDTNYVGYFPASSIPNLTGATAVQLFGEVDAMDDDPCTDMGGNPAELPTSTTYTSRISSVTYDKEGPAVSLVPLAPTPARYGAVIKSGSTRTLNYGGPSTC